MLSRQCKAVLDFMKTNGSIDLFTKNYIHGTIISYLPARIADLRHEGYCIGSETVKHPGGYTYKRYYLLKEPTDFTTNLMAQ